MSFLKYIPAAACLLALSAVLQAARPVSSQKQGFENYALLRTRNIFDPDRQPGASNTSVASQTPQPTPSVSDYAALTGTLITAEKALAFFSGSRPEFNAVLAAQGSIAGAIVTRITPDSVEVLRDGKRTVVFVGQTVPLDASSVPGIAPAAVPALSASPTTTNAASTPAPVSVDRESLMRRMMEKRQQELK